MCYNKRNVLESESKFMKRKLNYLLMIIALLTVILVGCGNSASGGNSQSSENTQESEKVCEHVYTEATCETPSYCTLCREVNGEALGHTLTEATCTEPAVCSVCGETEGEALGHSFTEATCAAPATCSVCGATEGSAKEHSFTAATCTTPATCSVCGATSGGAKGHSYSGATCTTPATCSVCGATGSYGGHNYQSGVCANCGKTSPASTAINLTASMDTALFIGDSRTEGLRIYTKEYTGTADFFSATSSSVSGIVYKNARVDVAGVGNVTISELLDQKRYDKVYIMLGINEAGNGPSVIAQNTKALVDLIQKKQPGTVVFIMANLYVSAGYSSSRPVFRTANMSAINAAQGALANGQDIFYLDANPMFVDGNGDLSTAYSSDGCHLSKSACKTFAAWIIEQTKSLLGL